MEDTPEPTTISTNDDARININSNFIRSKYGVLMMVQLVLGLVAWCIVVAWPVEDHALLFIQLLLAIPWSILLILFIILVFGVNSKINLPWNRIQIGVFVISTISFLFGTVMLVMYYQQMVMAASLFFGLQMDALNPSILIAPIAFGFIVGVLYIVSIVFTCKRTTSAYTPMC